MRKYRNLLFYTVVLVVFSVLIYFIIGQGVYLENSKSAVPAPAADLSSWQQFKLTFISNVTHPLAILLIQIITIIIVARVLGYLCKKIKQPSVIGEMAAGILLGPSFVGMYFPEFSGFLFPAQSLGNLQFLSQIGLILFMFVVGMELDLQVLRNKAKDAVIISHASIVFPFTLGIALAYFLYTGFAPGNVSFISFSLFIGIAMSITAFPVLARIVQERGLTKTKLGAIVITCAAADDITAWCILAIVIAVVKAGSVISASFTILMALVYVFLMVKLVRPFLKRIGEKFSDKESLSKPVVAIFFIILIISSWATEVIGIHALFGAFMAGVIMPPNIRFRSIFIEKLEDVALVLLLPLFFVFTGLRTQIGLLNEPYLWKVCAVVIAVAVAGKFLGSALAARFVGQSWRESLSIGALMNTRGLMELVVLNIGYDLGVLSPEIFSMLVIMALATTFMTGPALDIINKLLPGKKISQLPGEMLKPVKYNILVSFSTPEKGVSLLQLVNSLVKKTIAHTQITMLHLSPSNELNQYNQEEYERDSFAPIEQEAEKLLLPVTKIFKPSLEIDSEISQTANEGEYDLLLIGFGNSVYEGTLLGKILGFTNKIINPERLYETITGKEKLFETAALDERVKNIVRTSKLPVGIFIEKGFTEAKKVVLPIFSISDSFLLIYAQKLILNNQSEIVITDIGGVIQKSPEIKESIQSIEKITPGRISIYNEYQMNNAFLDSQDLMLISLESWKKAVETQSAWLSNAPSSLLIKP